MDARASVPAPAPRAYPPRMDQGHNSQHLDQRLDAYDPPCPEDRFTHTTAYDALVHAWDLLKLVVARFWGPVALGQLPGLAQWRMCDLLDWLRPIELMLRRLILLEATAMAPSLPQPAPARPHTPRPARYKPVDPERSETWTVRFHNLHEARPRPTLNYPRLSLRRDGSRSEFIAFRDRADLRDTWALARRLEAAIRVVSDPMPWIRRLARHIRRRGAPDLTRLPHPQKVRIPRTWPTLDAIGAELHLPPVPRPDTS